MAGLSIILKRATGAPSAKMADEEEGTSPEEMARGDLKTALGEFRTALMGDDPEKATDAFISLMDLHSAMGVPPPEEEEEPEEEEGPALFGMGR